MTDMQLTTPHPEKAPFPDGSGRGRAFQSRVHDWIIACFGEEIGADRIERNHRFIEEALELVQSNGCTRSEAHQLVDYVYDRPVGEPTQEVGGVMNTLAALCTASGIDMAEAGETELARVWTKVEKIRAKQAAKPKHSPLPQHVAPSDDPVRRLLTAAKLLYANAEGCAVNHYGDDFAIHGLPGWLADCAADIQAAEATLSKATGGQHV